MIAHVRDVHRHHAVPLALEVVLQVPALPRAEDGLRVPPHQPEVIVAAHQHAHDLLRVEVRPVGQHQHLLAVGLHRLTATRQHHDAAKHAALLLEVRVRVIPVGAAVPQIEAKRVRRIRLNGRRGDVRYAILLVRQQQPVPVRRSRLVLEPVVNTDASEVALAKAQCRPWNAAIDGEGPHSLARQVHGLLGDGQIILHHPLTGGGFRNFTVVTGQHGHGKPDKGEKKKAFHENRVVEVH